MGKWSDKLIVESTEIKIWAQGMKFIFTNNHKCMVK